MFSPLSQNIASSGIPVASGDTIDDVADDGERGLADDLMVRANKAGSR